MGHRNELHFHHFSRHNPMFGLDSLFITNYLLSTKTKPASKVPAQMIRNLSKLIMNISLDRQKR